MTGLEKIIETISKEAQAASEEKLAQAKQDAQAILEEAKSKQEVSYAESLRQADADANQILMRGQSAASLQERKLLLQAKQQIIQQVFLDAVDTICQMPAEEYFKLLLHMVDRYSIQENGWIHLSKEDLDRMPESFVKELGNRKVSISQEPAQVNGGFILSYGEIEENCSIDALLAANKEILTDQIVRLIF